MANDSRRSDTATPIASLPGQRHHRHRVCILHEERWGRMEERWGPEPPPLLRTPGINSRGGSGGFGPDLVFHRSKFKYLARDRPMTNRHEVRWPAPLAEGRRMRKEQMAKLPKNLLADHIPSKSMRVGCVRSFFVGGSFSFINLFTRYEVEGREHLSNVARGQGGGPRVDHGEQPRVAVRRPDGVDRGAQDPQLQRRDEVLVELACASNFNPQGKGARGPGDR